MIGSIDVTPCQKRTTASADGWLSLAAAPTFALMALLTGIRGGSMPDGSAPPRKVHRRCPKWCRCIC
jgi:hypothetical protein